MLAWQPPDSEELSPRSQHGPTSPPVAPHHGGAGSMGGLTPLSATAMRVQHSPVARTSDLGIDSHSTVGGCRCWPNNLCEQPPIYQCFGNHCDPETLISRQPTCASGRSEIATNSFLSILTDFLLLNQCDIGVQRFRILSSISSDIRDRRRAG